MAIDLRSPTAFGPGCPWYGLHQHFPPNIDWCEEKIGALVVTPLNSWSNVAYLIAAAFMWAAVRHTRDTTLRLFAPATALTGVTSFVCHQSLNVFSQVLDFFGMFALGVSLSMANLARMHLWPDGARGMRWYGLAVAALTGLTAASFMIGIPAQSYVAVLIVLIVWSELAQSATSRTYFWLSVLAMAVAAVFSALDLARVGCTATNHWFQPHAIWDIITALAIYLAFMHARRVARH